MVEHLNIAKDFSDTPGPRYNKEGTYSGQSFRETCLYPKLKACIESDNKLVINLDGTQVYGTSFLEEAFGGLIRVNHLSYDDIKEHTELISEEEPYLLEDIEQYLLDAKHDAQL